MCHHRGSGLEGCVTVGECRVRVADGGDNASSVQLRGEFWRSVKLRAKTDLGEIQACPESPCTRRALERGGIYWILGSGEFRAESGPSQMHPSESGSVLVLIHGFSVGLERLEKDLVGTLERCRAEQGGAVGGVHSCGRERSLTVPSP